MTATQNILFGESSQSLTFDCPAGRPSSVTSVTIYESIGSDQTQAESATTGTAAVETSPNTTVDVLSGPSAVSADPRRINLAATTGISVGRAYRITSGYGHFEDIEVEYLANGDYILSRFPLLNDYESGATFKSTRCTQALLDSWVADLMNLSVNDSPNPRYRVRWEVIVNSETRVFDTYFDLVRYDAAHTVSPLDVAKLFPPWLDWLGPDNRVDQGRSLIDRAARELKMEMAGDGKADQSIRNQEIRDELVAVRCLKNTFDDRVRAGGSVAPGEAESVDRLWRQRYDQLMRSTATAVDVTGDGGAAPVRPAFITRR